ncbi:hypothetical protein SRHO_G00185400 [Serrasalmus rhombeus]
MPLTKSAMVGQARVHQETNADKNSTLAEEVVDGTTEEEGKIQDRGQWASKAEFLLAVAGQIIGLGNVWRFPYLCYKNGGGVFFVPYLLFLVLCGIPLFLLEMALGQYTSLGGVSAWRSICPLFGGLGYASQVMILHGCVYYIIILAWALFYLGCSFQSKLPWAHCNNTWNTETCAVFEGENISGLPLNATSPVMEFWEREVLNVSDGVGELGSVHWRLALCLLAVWVVCYFCVWKGVKSTGKVVYVTATFPYAMLLVLLVRGATLPGAVEGIIYYLKPNHTRLSDPQVWMDAGTQIFFSYGICLGSLTALGSYNKFNNDCYRDTFLLCLLNSGTSFLAGFAIFAVLGFMAQEQNVHISEIAQSGPGLAFIVIPRAVSMMPLPQLWAVSFFLMIIMLGLDTQGGLYVFQIYDHFSCSGASLLLLSIFQSVAIGWVYGPDRFSNNIKSMIGYLPPSTFKLCWRYLTPAVCTGTFVFSLVSWSPLKLGKGVVAPVWATALGWLLALSSVSLLPLWTIYALMNTHGTLSQRLRILCHPVERSPAARKNSSNGMQLTFDFTTTPREAVLNVL